MIDQTQIAASKKRNWLKTSHADDAVYNMHLRLISHVKSLQHDEEYLDWDSDDE